MTIGWKLYLVLALSTVILYGVMIFWSLPFVSAQAGGLMPFDVRPTGYSFEDAQQFLANLSAPGADFYRGTQLRLDLFYPGMLATVLAVGLWRLSRRWTTAARVALVAFPVIGAIADYSENNGIARMLAAGSDHITIETVTTTSRWSGIKSATTTVAMFALLALLGFALYRHLNAKRTAR